MPEEHLLAVVWLYAVCFLAFPGIVILQSNIFTVGKGGDTLFGEGFKFKFRSTTVDIKFVVQKMELSSVCFGVQLIKNWQPLWGKH